MRSEGYSTWSVSVTQHLTFNLIIRATNDTTFSAVDEGRKVTIYSENASLWS